VSGGVNGGRHVTRHDQEHGSDAVTRYLAERGVSDSIRRSGLGGIVARWSAIASTAGRYDLTLDDWLNDLDLRDVIAGAIAVAPMREREEVRAVLERADAAFRAATSESAGSLWGASGHGARPHDRYRQWWYFRYPRNPGATMRADLAEAGITG
jgi:hypothetical protein